MSSLEALTPPHNITMSHAFPACSKSFIPHPKSSPSSHMFDLLAIINHHHHNRTADSTTLHSIACTCSSPPGPAFHSIPLQPPHQQLVILLTAHVHTHNTTTTTTTTKSRAAVFSCYQPIVFMADSPLLDVWAVRVKTSFLPVSNSSSYQRDLHLAVQPVVRLDLIIYPMVNDVGKLRWCPARPVPCHFP